MRVNLLILALILSPELPSTVPHKHKIVIACNHDTYLQTHEVACGPTAGGSSVSFIWRTIQVHSRTFNIFGSPCTSHHGSFAFQYPRTGMTDSTPRGRWSIPDNTHILVTHGHPHGHLDLTGLGCGAPPARIWELCRRQLLVLHVFGHVHGGRGIEVLLWNPVRSIWEDVVRKKGGWFCTMRLLYVMLRESQNSGVRTVSVNSSVVGGSRDRDVRSPIVIDI